MAWSWDHTQEAYSNARANLFDLPQRDLIVIWSEWKASDRDGNFDSEKYAKAEAYAGDLPDDALADDIWEKMEAQAKCENGGYDAWACPYGCHCHLISFDRNGEEGND